MTVLSTRGLSVSFDGHPILTDVDLDIRGGELVVLVGPNGAGKTTLLGVLSGDVDPSGGTGHPRRQGARVVRRPRAGPPACGAAAEAGAGLRLPGRTRWSGWAARRGTGPSARTTTTVVVAESMERADVTDLADRLYPTLSGGEQARTSFARLLAQETPVLMLDEPTAALDIRHQESLLAVARSAAQAGARRRRGAARPVPRRGVRRPHLRAVPRPGAGQRHVRPTCSPPSC